MSKKMKLPDVALDMISGGLLTHKGHAIEDLTVYLDYVEVKTSQGVEYLEFMVGDRVAIEKDPSLQDKWLDKFNEYNDMPGSHEISDVMGFPK